MQISSDMIQCGYDPVLWCFSNLYAFHLDESFTSYDRLPLSNAWKSSSRLMTKVQLVGVIVSLEVKVKRVEIKVDDGTGIADVVLWSNNLDKTISLGAMVQVRGNLKIYSGPNSTRKREVRITHISVVKDANEELLHWLQVCDAVERIYDTIFLPQCETSRPDSSTMETSSELEKVVMNVFFNCNLLEVNFEMCASKRTYRTQDLVEVLNILIDLQMNSVNALTFKFEDFMNNNYSHILEYSLKLRVLRNVFAYLRASGLLYLADIHSDEYMLITFKYVLLPWLMSHYDDSFQLSKFPEKILNEAQFRKLPLHWINIALNKFAADKIN